MVMDVMEETPSPAGFVDLLRVIGKLRLRCGRGSDRATCTCHRQVLLIDVRLLTNLTLPTAAKATTSTGTNAKSQDPPAQHKLAVPGSLVVLSNISIISELTQTSAKFKPSATCCPLPSTISYK
jgi:hypothetical protein